MCKLYRSEASIQIDILIHLSTILWVIFRHKQDGSQIGERTVDGDWIKFNPDGSQEKIGERKINVATNEGN